MQEFSILMPDPGRVPGLSRKPPRVFAWGTADENHYLWNGEPLGTVAAVSARWNVAARVASPFNRVERPGWWLERLPTRYARRVTSWKALSISSETQERYRGRVLGQSEDTFDLEAVLLEILSGETEWIVWCEHDVDQEPLLFTAMKPSEIARRACGLIVHGNEHRSFVAWPEGVAG